VPHLRPGGMARPNCRAQLARPKISVCAPSPPGGDGEARGGWRGPSIAGLGGSYSVGTPVLKHPRVLTLDEAISGATSPSDRPPLWRGWGTSDGARIALSAPAGACAQRKSPRKAAKNCQKRIEPDAGIRAKTEISVVFRASCRRRGHQRKGSLSHKR
jgi:hypothetical protein